MSNEELVPEKDVQPDKIPLTAEEIKEIEEQRERIRNMDMEGDLSEIYKEGPYSEEEKKIAYPFILGRNYFIRTVTYHHTGKLIAATKNELVLTNAAWIADDGRFATALETGEFSEIEPFPKKSHVIVGRNALIDALIHNHPLPTKQK